MRGVVGVERRPAGSDTAHRDPPARLPGRVRRFPATAVRLCRAQTPSAGPSPGTPPLLGRPARAWRFRSCATTPRRRPAHRRCRRPESIGRRRCLWRPASARPRCRFAPQLAVGAKHKHQVHVDRLKVLHGMVDFGALAGIADLAPQRMVGTEHVDHGRIDRLEGGDGLVDPGPLAAVRRDAPQHAVGAPMNKCLSASRKSPTFSSSRRASLPSIVARQSLAAPLRT